MAATFDSPVTDLKGVGGKMAETLAKLGIRTLGDLIWHLPLKYAQIGEVKPIWDWNRGDNARVEVAVVEAKARRGKRVPVVTAKAVDRAGDEIGLTWFGQPWLAKQLPNKKIVVGGPFEDGNPPRIVVKEFHWASDLGEDGYGRQLRPVYPLTEGLSVDRIRNLITLALDTLGELPDLPAGMLRRFELPTLTEAFRMIHQPETSEEPKAGRRRLAFDELLDAQLTLLLLRRIDRRATAPALENDSISEKLTAELPFELSTGQRKAWRQVRSLLSSDAPSRILVQGEVGAGKTVIAALAAAQAAGNDRISIVLAPTEILARQHFDTLSGFLRPAGVKVEMITGNTGKKERELVLHRLEYGQSFVLVGTHALFGEAASRLAGKLGVLVVDEQHRFGVGQRHQLIEQAQEKGTGVHFLQLSATPIPRTLALTVFGDLDVITLPAREDAQRNVETKMVRKDPEWVAELDAAQARGGAAFVIFPRIEDTGEGRALDSGELEQLRPDHTIVYAHGKMKTDERRDAINELADGSADVLAATTVIEVGIDIPRADCIVILDADRFGLAQLHQLRGRVGRAGQPSVCVIVPSVDASPEALARLHVLSETHDGLTLAEADLRLRGTGALAGDSQTGRGEYRVAKLGRDKRTLAEARYAARRILERDPKLARPEHAEIRTTQLAKIARMQRVRQA